MAHPRKHHQRGKVIANVGYLRIYQKNTNEESVVNNVKKTRTTKTDIAIYHRKKLLAPGYKNKALAIQAAQEYLNP